MESGRKIHHVATSSLQTGARVYEKGQQARREVEKRLGKKKICCAGSTALVFMPVSEVRSGKTRPHTHTHTHSQEP